MSEARMIDVVHAALRHHGIDDQVTAVGESLTRGHTGGGFAVSRDNLQVRVHQRVNVRVLEMIDEPTNSRIELEGDRLPVTHARDVMDELSRAGQ